MTNKVKRINVNFNKDGLNLNIEVEGKYIHADRECNIPSYFDVYDVFHDNVNISDSLTEDELFEICEAVTRKIETYEPTEE